MKPLKQITYIFQNHSNYIAAVVCCVILVSAGISFDRSTHVRTKVEPHQVKEIIHTTQVPEVTHTECNDAQQIQEIPCTENSKLKPITE